MIKSHKTCLLTDRRVIACLLNCLVLTVLLLIVLQNHQRMNRVFEQCCTISKMDKYLLECRRQEKNYLIRGDLEALDLFKLNHEALLASIQDLDTSSDQFYVDRRGSLAKILVEYSDSFMAHLQFRPWPDRSREADRLIFKCIELARQGHDIISELNEHFLTIYTEVKHLSLIRISITFIMGMIFQVLLVLAVIRPGPGLKNSA